MNLSRWIRRQMLIPRARRVAFERHFLELEEHLAKIREDVPPWTRRIYADEVE